MRSHRISKRGLSSLVSTIIVGAFFLPVIVCASYARDRAMADDGYCSDRHSDAQNGFAPGRGDLDKNYSCTMYSIKKFLTSLTKALSTVYVNCTVGVEVLLYNY
ncbi:hypothetical protein AVEN_49022-1 [Araneus ventricosus]|uniref:Uncharacterized protein n=1 Tax=Araneus ventricosus TaxID=182803 RepID=A0A4Y2AGZ5_ARAVE|nr:hypothetical protein AVEN_49022-1 [Araneus ventricosus]